MRVPLDEHLPVDLASELHGHDVDTVVIRGWAGIKNGDLLHRMRDDYDVFVTMDRSIEFQQNVSALPFGVVLVRAASNRMQHLRPLGPAILNANRSEQARPDPPDRSLKPTLSGPAQPGAAAAR